MDTVQTQTNSSKLEVVLSSRDSRRRVIDIDWRTMVDSELILVADDHPVFRDGLKRLLSTASPDANIIEAGSMEEVLAIASQPPAPSLFVLDLVFPGMKPKETLPYLRERFPRSSIVIVSMVDDEATVQQIMRLGADGFVGKAVSSQKIVDGIMAVKAGQFVVMRAEQDNAKPGDGTGVLDLTPRQKDVLQCLAQDKSNKEIGRMLSISPFTVRIHVSALLRILQVESRAIAAVKARALGF
jgi:DNA-binding NarL/FixJ family response regulator